jgi:hypothetical protein
MEGFFFLLVFGLIIVIVFMVVAAAKQRVADFIQHEVEKLGGHDVYVKSIMDNERDTWTFSVSYRDGSGLSHQTVCKTRATTSSRNHYQLYWRDSLRLPSQRPFSNSYKEQLIGDLQAENQRLQAKLVHGTQMTTPASSSKEQIISDLAAENERLQAELDTLRRTNE